MLTYPFIESRNDEVIGINRTNSFRDKLRITYFLLTCVTFLLCISSVFGQKLKYNVVQNNDVIGWLKLDKKDSANFSLIKFSSEIKKRLVILFTVIEEQEALFQNGILTRSYVYRKINDDIKVNKQTIYTGDHYVIKNEKTSTPLMLNNIAYNQLSLYFREPNSINEVYSDHYERYLKIEKNGNENYTLKLPNGNKNTYYYSNGVCTKVKVEQSLFTIEFVLIK
jgi:hypothetical protein